MLAETRPFDVTLAAVAPTEDPLPVIRGGGEPDTASEIKAGQIAEKPVEEMPEEVETKEDEPARKRNAKRRPRRYKRRHKWNRTSKLPVAQPRDRAPRRRWSNSKSAG